MPRHGDDHSLPPHRINYRANVWAMRQRRGAADPRAVRLRLAEARAEPGHVRRRATSSWTAPRAREDTFYDGPQTTHVSAADPYCRDLSGVLVESAREEGIEAVDGGTVVVIQGPRFSTRAESRWFAADGWDVVNMTQYPECWLARELGLCYANVSLVTDYDAGLEGMPDVEPVSTEAAFGGIPPRTSIDCARSCSGRCRRSGHSRTTPALRRWKTRSFTTSAAPPAH